MNRLDGFRKLFRKKAPDVSGITIYFLQKNLERFTGEQLSQVMQRGWHKEYDEQNFYGMSTFDGEGGLLKFNAMFFPMQHFDRRVDGGSLAGLELPLWAEHNAYTSFGYACPGGIPEGETRDTFYCLLEMFCAELLTENTQALYFVEDRILLRYDDWLIKQLRARKLRNPALLRSAQRALP